MNSAQQTSFEPNPVPHPGETVLEYLDFYGWSQRDLARRTGLTPKTISEICNGKAPITPPTALDFAEMIGVGPGIVVGRLQHEGVLERHQGTRSNRN